MLNSCSKEHNSRARFTAANRTPTGAYKTEGQLFCWVELFCSRFVDPEMDV
uniref:Uncharacterized protein n=1 Tax=Anguilla anguilla TaxID=7936 RepID=A0A0E9U5H8_ANGAN